MGTIKQQLHTPTPKSPREEQREVVVRTKQFQGTICDLAGKGKFCDPYGNYETVRSSCDMAEIYENIKIDLENGISKNQIVEQYAKKIDVVCDGKFCDADVKNGLVDFFDLIRNNKASLPKEIAT